MLAATYNYKGIINKCLTFKSITTWGFPGSPVVKTPCFHCRGSGFDPTRQAARPKKKKSITTIQMYSKVR